MRATVVMMVLWLAACLQPGAVECRDGRVCPEGTTCVDALGVCARPDERDVCQTEGANGGDPCTAAGVAGVCSGALTGVPCTACVCMPARCGDGVITAPEECDGELLGAEPRCDQHGYYETTNVACNAICQYDVEPCSRTCGDGVLELAFGEQCDDTIEPLEPCTAFGFDAGFAGCRAGGCSPDVRQCRRIGWTPVVLDSASMIALTVAAGNVFVTGTELSGTTYRLVTWQHDGARWIRSNSDVEMISTSIYAASATSMVVVGVNSSASEGIIARLDGTTWTTQTLTGATFPQVAGNAANDVWVFGGDGVTRHFDGTSWTPGSVATGLTGYRPQGAIAFGTSDVWYLTTNFTTTKLFHFTGTWQEVTIPTPPPNSQFAINRVGNALYLSESNTTYRRDGTVWTPVLAGLQFVQTIHGSTENDLYALGYRPGGSYTVFHYDGSDWTRVETTFTSSFGSIGGTDASGVLLMMQSGQIYRYSGNTWNETIVGGDSFASVTGSSNGDVFVAELGAGVHRFSGATKTFTSMVGVGSVGRVGDTMYAVGYQLISRWTGSAWQPETIVAGKTDYFRVAGTSTAAFALTDLNSIAKRSGAAWVLDLDGEPSSMPALPDLFDLWCGTTVCVAVGDIVHMWNGSTWSSQMLPDRLVSVWGSSDTDIYAVSSLNSIYHYDGSSWKATVRLPDPDSITSISGSAADDIVAISQFGDHLYHFDGTHWAPMRTATSGERLWDVFVTPQTIWAVGDDQTGPPPLGRTVLLERTYPW